MHREDKVSMGKPSTKPEKLTWIQNIWDIALPLNMNPKYSDTSNGLVDM